MDLIAKATERQNGAGRKRKHGAHRTFFQWFVDNSDPSGDDIAEVCWEIIILKIVLFDISNCLVSRHLQYPSSVYPGTILCEHDIYQI